MPELRIEPEFIVEEPHVMLMSRCSQSEALDIIERVGRTCYQSKNLIGEGSAEKFLEARLYQDHHDSLLEHYVVTVAFYCDRGVANQITRHRLCSFAQTSTRYVNYSKEKFGSKIACIPPPFLSDGGWNRWVEACNEAQRQYMEMLKEGETPEIARSVLPLSLSTELCATANLREWRHFFNLRTSSRAHPQMREIAYMLLSLFNSTIPIFFKDIEPELVIDGSIEED